VAALVGPPGVGKTTTLIKLAAQLGLAEGKSTQILSADVYRIGAADQLRTLSSILGIGCTVAETPLALEQALEEHRSKQLVLIDTPGWSYREMEEGSPACLDLARVLALHPEMDTHLLLAASMNPADMACAAERYKVFRPRKLILTRIDETVCCAALAREAARLSLPVSFFTTGQRIPNDIESASEERLAARALAAPQPQGLGAAA
jgi:flagellar biosynthesis protein FlhF